MINLVFIAIVIGFRKVIVELIISCITDIFWLLCFVGVERLNEPFVEVRRANQNLGSSNLASLLGLVASLKIDHLTT